MSSKPVDYLKDLRIKRGYTQQEVADFLGVTKATISKYEKGQRQINHEYIEKLAELYGVEPIYILTGITGEEWQRRMEESADAAYQADREYWKSVLFTDTASEILSLLDMLNELGQTKAIERISELTEIPKYRRD